MCRNVCMFVDRNICMCFFEDNFACCDGRAYRWTETGVVVHAGLRENGNMNNRRTNAQRINFNLDIS